jgi:hypothetical protein
MRQTETLENMNTTQTKQINKALASLEKVPAHQIGDGRQPSKYLLLVDQALSLLEADVEEHEISEQFRQAYIKAHSLESNLAKDKGYVLFNALLWRAMLIAKRGRTWVEENRQKGFNNLYQLARGAISTPTPVRVSAKAARAKSAVRTTKAKASATPKNNRRRQAAAKRR